MKISPLIRTALFVSDLDRSTDFYRDVLSLEDVFWEGELAGESLERLLAVPAGARCQARILQSGAVSVGMVGLFAVSSAAKAAEQPGVRPGAACLVFYCSDLDEVMRRVDAGGHRLICEPTPLVHEGRIKQREMTLADPDGVMINLIEWDPDAADKPEHS